MAMSSIFLLESQVCTTTTTFSFYGVREDQRQGSVCARQVLCRLSSAAAQET